MGRNIDDVEQIQYVKELLKEIKGFGFQEIMGFGLGQGLDVFLV